MVSLALDDRDYERSRRRQKRNLFEERRERESAGRRDKSDTHAKYSKFVRRMAAILSKHPSDVYNLLAKSEVHSARINTLKVKLLKDFENAASESGLASQPIPWYPDAFSFVGDKKEIFQSSVISSGKAFIQNASSFLPVLALQPQAGEQILDVCASPGGKSSHIAALTDNQAHLWVNDGNQARIAKIEDVQNILGFRSEKLTCFDGKFTDREVDRTFDKILLDAQCSGEGMMDLADPQSLEHWNLPRVNKHYHLQTKMLRAAFKVLNPGGVMIYSTCTYAPEENEAPISTLLRDFKDATVEPLIFDEPNVMPALKQWEGTQYDPRVSGALRILPHEYMEGFFVCRIRKLGGEFNPNDLHSVNLKAEGINRSKVGHRLG